MRGIGQFPARLSGGFQSPTEINASGGSQPRNTRVFRHEIRAQSDARLHREYNLAMKNKVGEQKIFAASLKKFLQAGMMSVRITNAGSHLFVRNQRRS